MKGRREPNEREAQDVSEPFTAFYSAFVCLKSISAVSEVAAESELPPKYQRLERLFVDELMKPKQANI